MQINSQNIQDFIQYLYQKRLQQQPTQEVVDSWSGLNDEEVKQYLNELFRSWQYSDAAAQEEVEAYFRSKNPTTQAPYIPQNTPQERVTTFSEAPVTTAPPTPYYVNTPKKRSPAIWLLLLLPIIAIAGYVLYKYQQFQSLPYVYVTTDNVTIRDFEGNAIGRMDIYPTANSVSYLRAADDKSYNIQVKDKAYACRKVTFNETQFWDFLTNKKEAFGYVNENYLIDDKDNFLIYRTVFKEINNAKNENNNLTSAYRKVIIGSIKLAPNLNGLYIVNTCSNADKNYSSMIKQSLKNNVYGVVAKISDGGFYAFYGNPETQEFEAPRLLKVKPAFSNTFTDFKDYNFLFKQANGYFYLFNCDGSAADYFAHPDGNGKIDYIQSSFEPI